MRAACMWGLLAGLMLNVLPLTAADWVRIEIPGVEIFTDAGVKSALAVAERLESIRTTLPQAPSRDGPLELRVFLFRTESEFRPYAPNRTTPGFYQSGRDRDYILLRANQGLTNAVVHEYVHFVLNQGAWRATRRPAWLEEGLAEYYSNTGASHTDLLRRERWLTAEQMLAPPAGVAAGDQHLSGLFYAQSWALVHMLAQDPDFGGLLQRLAEGKNEFDIPGALERLPAYLRQLRPVRWNGSPAKGSPPEPKTVSTLDALLLRGELALRTGHGDIARGLYAEAASRYPNSAVVETGLAELADIEGDSAAARTHLQRALALNDRSAEAWFQWAMLVNDTAALQKVVAIDPSFGEARLLLGVRATDDGNLEVALGHLEQAVRLLPRRSYAWYSLAFAQQKRPEQRATARESLEQALRLAATPEQRTMAQTLLDSLR